MRYAFRRCVALSALLVPVAPHASTLRIHGLLAELGNPAPSPAGAGKQAQPAPNVAKAELPPKTDQPAAAAIAASSALMIRTAPMLHVTYSNGELRIDAENSTLSNILDAIHANTGAEITGGNGAAESATAHLSGPAIEVISALLNGSAWDYILLATPEDQARPAQIILTPREIHRTEDASIMDRRPAAGSAHLPGVPHVANSTIDQADGADSDIAVRSAAPDSSSPAAATPNSGIPAGWHPVAPPEASNSSNADGNPAGEGEQQVSPAGQYLQEMYRLRQQQPAGNQPPPH